MMCILKDLPNYPDNFQNLLVFWFFFFFENVPVSRRHHRNQEGNPQSHGTEKPPLPLPASPPRRQPGLAAAAPAPLSPRTGDIRALPWQPGRT